MSDKLIKSDLSTSEPAKSDLSNDSMCQSGALAKTSNAPHLITGSNNSELKPEHKSGIFSSLRLLFWPQHEPWIAAILLVCLVGISAYFIQRSVIHDGLIEIDNSGALSAEFRVDVNHADVGEFVNLPGVGEKLAQAIIDYRTDVGGFNSLESLCEVPGIGERKLETLMPYLVPFEPN